MVNKAQQDAFVDDEVDTCPLCVEEFDLSDRNFRPCPCGYQVCQFCFNNIKSNMNGLCPACRRPYDDKTIEWKVVSPEEFKADVAAQARKKAAARQKEAERKQVETLNKKHLAGLRVLQKNLVYVVGMDISGDEHALETLRGPNHFGQYGEIIKIVASKAKEGYAGHQSTGIYVTFARKEDAATCIATVDGTPHEGRVLRAQYGTTKYCSSFLRNERCTNRSCMFLHETGDDNDSFSRQDLSSFNAASSQRSAPPSVTTAAKITYQNPTQIASPAPAPSVAAQVVRPEAASRSESDGDGPALPTTATWAKNPQLELSRRSSQVGSRSTPSPKLVNAKPILSRPTSRAGKVFAEAKSKPKKAPVQNPPATTEPEPSPKGADPRKLWVDAMNTIRAEHFVWKFDRSLFDPATLAIVDHFPPYLDLNGGTLRVMRRKELEKQELENARKSGQMNAPANEEGQFAGGSLQLGGEPENGDEFSSQRDNRGQIPFGVNDSQSFDRQAGLPGEFSNLGIGGRGLTSHQQRNISLLMASNILQDSTSDQTRNSAPSQHHSQLSNPFQSQNLQQLNSLSRHGRQTSRFTFSPDPSAAPGSAKPLSNVQSMNQMSHAAQKNFVITQPGMQSTFYSGVQGPPPGLKASGTPPISGGGMFGQGHGFASVMGGGSSFGNSLGKGSEETSRDLLRGRPGADAGKLDLTDPSILQTRNHHPTTIGQASYSGNQTQDLPSFNGPHGSAPEMPQRTAFQDLSRSATPFVAPGFGPAEFPPLIPSQTSTATGTTAMKSTNPAILTTYRSETTRNITKVSPSEAPSVAQSKRHQNLTVDDYANTDHGDSPKRSTISARDMTESPLGAANQVQVDARPSSKLEPLTSKSETALATESKHKLITKATIADMSTSSESKSSMSTVQGARMASTSATTKGAEIQSPRPVRNPRTLRLVTAVKAEDSSASSTPADTATTTSEAFTSKSMAQDPDHPSAKQSGTPVTEIVSEDASIASASTSQPGTPNLSSRVHFGDDWSSVGSRVQAGPSVNRSKNQIKKERQARAKQLEELKAEDVSLTDESVQAPIIGRKKKIKKAKSAVHERADLQASPSIPDLQSDGIHSGIETTENDVKTMQQPKLTVSSILASLKAEGMLDTSDLECFLNPAGLNARYDIDTSHLFEYSLITDLDEEEKKTLNRGDCIVKQLNPGEWGVVLPNRGVLRYLSKEEAYRYMRSRFEVIHNSTNTFDATDYPREAWMNLTANDILDGLPVAPPLDGMQNKNFHSNSSKTESLVNNFASAQLRPDPKDLSYGALYPPRDEAENEEIAARMAMYTPEEAEQIVKQSEELLHTARKEVEHVDRNFQAPLKKNRKIFKDWYI